MTTRIEVVTECIHGHPRDLAADWSTCIVPDCPGGSRRVLDPGYDVYRPDDCAVAETQLHMDATRGRFCLEIETAGTYRLVPVGGAS